MSQDIPILLYHSVNDDPPPGFKPWAVSRALFEAHLDKLIELNVVGLSIAQLMELIRTGSPVPKRVAVLTFDDGFADFAANAWPLLKARGLPATLYVTAGALGGRSKWLEPIGAGQLPMLGQAEILALALNGVEIGAHSMTHPQLDCIGREQARNEIIESKLVLETILGRPVDSFAYPHGYHDRAIKKMVADAGYTSAAAVRNALSHSQDDRYALARFTVMSDCTVEQLEGVLDGSLASRAKPEERWQTIAWRQVRRFRSRIGR